MVKKKAPGRPKKPPDQVRAEDLRIPVTPAEKARVQAAVEAAQAEGLAAWARSVLLSAADRLLAKKKI
jgi:hypothetical protein